jgi:hypothetical protein
MFANSYYVILLGLLVGIPTLIFLFLAFKKGHFNELDKVSYFIFDEEDLRYVRPWESHRQKVERVEQHGAALPPRTEWFKWL